MATRINYKRNQKFHYSPLRYPGGKTFLWPFLDKVIRNNGLSNITYVEPFAGGAGAALALLLMERVERVVINDLDKAIYSFWESAIFDSERFIEKIYSTPINITEWKRQKRIHHDRRSSLFNLGFATFFLNRTNVSGILDGGPIGGMDQRGPWKLNARFNKDTLAHRIRELAFYKNRISVSNRDGIDLVKEYLKRENTFVYLDPPYYEKGSTLYLNHYKNADHKALASQLNCRKDAHWLLTYDNRTEIRSLYLGRHIIDFTLNYNAYELRRGKEIMICSDAIKV